MVELRTIWNRGVSFLEDGLLDSAGDEFEAGERRAAEYGISWGGYGLDHKVGRLRVAFQRGDWDLAGRIAGSVGPAASSGVAGLVAAAGLLVSVARGDLDEAESRIEALGAQPPMHDQTVLLLGQAGAECALWRGDPAAASDRVDAALRGLRAEVPYHLGELVLSALGVAARADLAARADPAETERIRSEADALLRSAETVAERGLPRGTRIGPEGRAWLLQARAELTRVHDEPSPDAWTAVIDAFGYGDGYRQACARFRRAGALLAAAARSPDRTGRSTLEQDATDAGGPGGGMAPEATGAGNVPLPGTTGPGGVQASDATGRSSVRTDAETTVRPAVPQDLRRAAAEDLRAAAVVADALGARALAAAVAELAARSGTSTRPGAGQDAGGATPTGPLTPRERAVLEQVALGLTNRRVGEVLFISEKTVSVHLSRLMAKLGAAGRAEAVSLAYERGLLTVAAPGSEPARRN